MKIFKPTSLIFMIVAVVLIAAGVILCVIGGSMADKRNIELFAESVDENGNTVSCRSFGDVSKGAGKTIKIELDSCDIHFIGGAKRNEVRIINFAENAFDYSVSNGEVKLKDAGIFSAFNFISESGTNFRGLRHYLVALRFAKKHRVVEVYFNSENKTTSKIEVTLENGDITFEGLALSDELSVKVKLTNGNVSVSGCTGGTLDVEVANGDISSKENEIDNEVLAVKEIGDINCKAAERRSYTLNAVNGVVYLDGENTGKKFAGVYPNKINAPSEEKNETDKHETKEDADDESDTEVEASGVLPISVRANTFSGDIFIETELD